MVSLESKATSPSRPLTLPPPASPASPPTPLADTRVCARTHALTFGFSSPKWQNAILKTPGSKSSTRSPCLPLRKPNTIDPGLIVHFMARRQQPTPLPQNRPNPQPPQPPTLVFFFFFSKCCCSAWTATSTQRCQQLNDNLPETIPPNVALLGQEAVGS